jgi:hypothetical protein
MTSIYFYSLTAILCLVLASCNETKRVDGSSEEKMRASIEQMRKGLSDAEKEALGKDMMPVAFADVNLFQAGHAPDLFQQQMRDRLNGKTREEIHQLAEDVRKRMEANAEESRKKAEARRENPRRSAPSECVSPD